MKKYLGVLAVVALLASPSMAGPTNGAGYDGGAIYIRQNPGGSYGSGGEFQIISDSVDGKGLKLNLGTYSSLTKGTTTLGDSPTVTRAYFDTFSIETNGAMVGSSTTMNLWVSTQNKDLGPGSHAWGGGKDFADGDDLNTQTAYLYTQFAIGNLTAYGYTGSASERSTSALALQQAIWYLEGEMAYNTLNRQAVAWVQQAVDATRTPTTEVSITTVEARTFWGIGNVRVLQAYTGSRTDDGALQQQDLLFLQNPAYVQVPAPGAALLVALGIGVVGWVKRRLA